MQYSSIRSIPTSYLYVVVVWEQKNLTIGIGILFVSDFELEKYAFLNWVLGGYYLRIHICKYKRG